MSNDVEIKNLTEEMKKISADAAAEIKASQEDRKTFGENSAKQTELLTKVEKMLADMNTKQEEIIKRKGEFTGDPNITTKAVSEGEIQYKALIETPSNDALVKEIQKKNDEVLMMAQILRKDPRELASFKSFQKFMKENTELKTAMSSTGAGYGDEWVPTGYSANLYELIRLEQKVAALFQVITMPTNPYVIPLQTADSTSYYVSENTSESGTKFTHSTATTSNKTLTAKKMAVRTLFSEELREDTIIPIMPFVQRNTVQAIANGFEKALINGDTTSPHLDTDSDDTSGDIRTIWDGLRDIALNLTTAGASSQGAGTLYGSNFMTMRAKMGKYGTDPAKLAYIVSMSTYAKMITMLNDSTSTGGSPLVTIDKYGANATILKGELGQLYGSPVIVSEYMREDLNSSGVYQAGQTLTCILSVYKPGFLIGEKRAITLKTDTDIETDQQIVVATTRKDFIKIYGAASGSTDVIVYDYYNVAV